MKADRFWEEVRRFAEGATAPVGARLLEEHGRVGAAVHAKGDGTLVTESDRFADDSLRAAVKGAFPDHGVLSEEGSTRFPDTEWCWVIDPLDGTTNFARGIPIWAISLGLLHRGRPVFGHVRVPTLGHVYHGFGRAPGAPTSEPGAFRNGAPIRTSREDPGRNQFFSVCSRSVRVTGNGMACKIRMLGSAAHNLLLVASGAALAAVEATPKVWDLAGAWPIVHGAGGTIRLLGAAPFPLEPGREYENVSCPVLAVAREELLAHFLPPVEEAFGKE